MLSYPRTDATGTTPLVRLIGVGNAGVHLADRITMSGLAGLDIVAMNTDVQSLSSSIVQTKVTLGPLATRGLGAGGDPELGFEAARESLAEIQSSIEGANVIFLCAGLGGGTASGAAPVLAEAARESGAVLISLITTPFTFEGRRRAAQASEALDAIARQSAALLHFENDRMSELSSPRAGIEETFAISDQFLSASVTSFVEMLQAGGPLPVSLADLLAAIGGGTASALFGRGEAEGDNRAHEALERAMKSPLLDRGRVLTEAHAVLAHITGPASMSFSEMATIMRELSKHTARDARLFLGASTSNDPSAPVRVTILGNFEVEAAQSTPRKPADPVVESEPEIRDVEQSFSMEPPGRLFADEEPPAGEDKPRRPRTAPPKEIPPPKKPVTSKARQENLQFEPVARGRFEKSEPTILEGEDLDVPTFLRMRGKP